MTTSNEIVLVTGGSGFIGQHLIRMLLREKDKQGISEIRSVDLVPYENKIGHPKTTELHTYVGDICQPETVKEAFENVGTVFHCAALVSLEYPPNYEELERVNVTGTRTVVELCIKNNIPRLIYTSCASVCLVPFKGSTFTIVINQTESKAPTPDYDVAKLEQFDKSFFIPGYSSSKARAEKIVLNTNGASLSNQNECLTTVAIRPPLTYGECDSHFVPTVFEYLSRHGNIYPRIAGAGGKQQLAYAGNVAWGHICAYKTLKATPKAIAGLPVFITDDTPIYDLARFIQKMALLSGKFRVNTSSWYVPHFLFYFLAFIIELFMKLLHPFTKSRLRYSLRAIASFSASVLMFSRLRASIHMDYTPLIEAETAAQLSANYYAKWWEQNIGDRKSKKR